MPAENTNAEILREFAHIVAERYVTADRELPAKQKVSGLSIPLNKGLMKARRWCSVAASGAVVISILDLIWAFPVPVSAITVACCELLLVLLLVETVTLTGEKQESEFRMGNEYSRELVFHPSIRSVTFLTAILLLGTLGMTLGFAGMHYWLYRQGTGNYSARLDVFSSVYYSIVTFATIGYGDILPMSSLARIVTTIQILLSWSSTALVLSVIIPWITTNHQQRIARLLSRQESRMNRTEQIMKKAGLGVYGDVDEITAEAKRRVQARHLETKSKKTPIRPKAKP